MIPKVIHYCWFGRNPLPELALKCIASWKKYLPGYEIKEWNEDNFDINLVPYTQEAYEAKKYAFVSDYARFWILYHYGGLYFDTDVEIIKPIDDVIEKGPFMGREREATDEYSSVAPGLGLGVTPGLGLYKDLLNKYATIRFLNPDGSFNQTTVVKYTSDLLIEYGLKNEPGIQQCAGIWIYPKEYFCPKSFINNRMDITSNTRSIHHYTASWATPFDRLKHFIQRVLGRKISAIIANLKK